jgi:hypothetical protein
VVIRGPDADAWDSPDHNLHEDTVSAIREIMAVLGSGFNADPIMRALPRWAQMLESSTNTHTYTHTHIHAH